MRLEDKTKNEDLINLWLLIDLHLAPKLSNVESRSFCFYFFLQFSSDATTNPSTSFVPM